MIVRGEPDQRSRPRATRAPERSLAVAAVVPAAVVLGAVVLGACRGPSTEDSFCAQLEIVQQAGPLFPARTDGEPVPDQAALAAIEGLAEHRPPPIADAIDVLVDEARTLSTQAQERLGRSAQVEPPTGRWSRSAVESAQSAVITYAGQECDVDLLPSGEG